MLIGIGNDLNGDDAVGCHIADSFSARDWLVVNAGTVPENFAGLVNKEKPIVLVIVDAADLGLAPGEMRRLEKDQANSAFYSTHSLPISQFVDQVQAAVREIVIIGIQPKDLSQFSSLSPELKAAAEKMNGILEEKSWGEEIKPI